jgi:hypothetical protein
MLVAAIVGCGGSQPAPRALRLPPDERPTPVGSGLRFRIPALSAAVAHRAPVGGLRCQSPARLSQPYGIHLELFADRRVVPIPAGIGVAPPQHRHGVYVLGGACVYSLRTLEPTGVVRVSLAGARVPTLGELFSVWGQPLARRRLAGFTGPVLAFVDGRRWVSSPFLIPLRRHAEIVLEVGGRIPPHPRYRFPPGL